MKYLKRFTLVIVVLMCIYGLMGWYVKSTMFYIPTVDKQDLMPVLTKSSRTEADYQFLFEQTGLTRPIIEVLEKEADFIPEMLEYQASYLEPLSPTKTNMNFITRMDQTFDDGGNASQAFKLAPYRNGYIFLTKSTYTGNWRHGHAGLVVDDIRGKTLESLEPGTVSMEQNANRWAYYPTFKMMRLKDTPQEKLDAIAAYARENLYGIPYNILVSKSAAETFTSTHCSFIVWQAFKAFDIDLDSTGGIWVSPENIGNSPYLELLQIHGFDPSKGW